MDKTTVNAFLESFNTTYLGKGSGLLSSCTLQVCTNLPEYHKLTKNTTRLTSIPEDQIIWVVKDMDELLLSSLHLTYIKGLLHGARTGTQQIVQWSYSFTREDEKYRRCGLNTTLRLASMLWANSNGWDYINSVPFEHAHSNAILQKMGFTKLYDNYDDSMYYIKDITSKQQVINMCDSMIAKYL